MPNEQQGDVLPAHEEGGRIPKGEDREHGRGRKGGTIEGSGVNFQGGKCAMVWILNVSLSKFMNRNIMAGIKSLAKDTAIYGLSSIVGKFLNWCLTPLYTYLLVPAEYSVIVNLYAWIGVMLVLLTYGLETGFFRFANDPSKGEPQTVYATCMTSIGVTTITFLAVVGIFLEPITRLLQCGAHPEYVVMIAVIIALDVFASLPFAYLRYQQRPLRFAGLKLLNIGLTIALNCFFLLGCPAIYSRHPEWISWFYDPGYGVGYILVANVMASAIILLALLPEVVRIRWRFRWGLLREILHYSFPLLILGLAGMLNQNFDKMMFPYLMEDPQEAATQLGIYGANAKIAVVMIMFTQAFRYAYEPFIFARAKGEDKRGTYAAVMKYFVIFELLIFLGVVFYLDIIRYFVGPEYFAGLTVVPIIMLAELFSGIFFNLSLWYKLTDRTQWGVYFSFIGLAVIVAGNVLFVPRFGYIACAWSAFACFFAMMFFSWLVGQKYYPIRYDLKGMARYAVLALALYALGTGIPIDNMALRLSFRTLLLCLYVLYVIRKDLPLSEIPIINRWVRK